MPKPQADYANGKRAVSTVLFLALQTDAGANGGIASLGEILRSLTRYRPVVLTNRESPVTQAWRNEGIEVHILEEQASRGWRAAPLATVRTYFRYFAAVRRILARSGARIVHANDPLAFQLAYPAARSMSVRIVLNIRDTLGAGRKPPKRKYDWLFSSADHTLFLSQDMKERWAQICPVVRESSSATYSIVDFERFTPRPLNAAGSRIVLISGVICPKKGQLAFLQHVAPILASSGIECWFSGDFLPERDAYSAECAIAAAPLGNAVKFLGYRADLPQLIAKAHVVAISSQYEGLMRTMIESMASGRPVVSTDVASAREMLERSEMPAGEVFGFDHWQDMARSIIDLCVDEDRNIRLGNNGANIARELFARAHVVSAYESCYDELSTDVAGKP